MQCPRCKTHDVYRSQSGSQHIFSFVMMTVRCHRCCLLFSVPRWKDVPSKPVTKISSQQRSLEPSHRAA